MTSTCLASSSVLTCSHHHLAYLHSCHLFFHSSTFIPPPRNLPRLPPFTTPLLPVPYLVHAFSYLLIYSPNPPHCFGRLFTNTHTFPRPSLLSVTRSYISALSRASPTPLTHPHILHLLFYAFLIPSKPFLVLLRITSFPSTQLRLHYLPTPCIPCHGLL